MQLGLSIEENYFTTSVLDKTGSGVVVELNKRKRDFHASLLISGQHAYTEDNIHAVKMADPALPVFDEIITNGRSRTDLTGRVWHRSQLLSVLAKKILFIINSHFVDSVDQITLLISGRNDERLEEDLRKALAVNGVDEIATRSEQEAVKRYLTQTSKDHAEVLELSENLFAEDGSKKFSGSTLLNIFFDEFAKQYGQSKSLESAHYLIRHELKKILEKVLNGDQNAAHLIVMDRDRMLFDAPIDKVKKKIRKCLSSSLASMQKEPLFCTGRLVRYSLIREIIEDIAPEGTEMTFDLANEAKVLGLLNYNKR